MGVGGMSEQSTCILLLSYSRKVARSREIRDDAVRTLGTCASLGSLVPFHILLTGTIAPT